MSRQPISSLADLLGLVRVCLGVVVLVELLGSQASRLVLPLVAVACLTDWLDGRLARAAGGGTDRGRLLDNLADASFLALAFWSFGAAEVWSHPLAGHATRYFGGANWLPLAGLAMSFGAYMLRWYLSARRGCPLAPSPQGHAAGVFNWALALVGGVAVLPGVHLTPWLVEPIFLTVFLLNLSAAGENLRLLVVEAWSAKR